ncbi:MAG: methylenetetrahydrofolate--tRNA-(uracil(54)-C(5))-methyltransferase (FADH(2)-oxidizing) TrmFO [Synergistaceae bacterium]|nr:methylenetetrahydrofolate--tRNA-(uracil(54)-C(5))-methyltransferase (FADH(2)-oxidizing) TrmFO [Synergistaceae bacterium]
MNKVSIVGGGLAGSEAAWQLARRGIEVILFEMRPNKSTPAHKTDKFAEIVCSNSFGANDISSPAGILKRELKIFNSLIMECAENSQVPAGKALAVDRDIFSSLVTERLSSMPTIKIIREEISEPPEGAVIIATGPLTSMPLAQSLKSLIGDDYLSFYDAVAPIILAESIDRSVAWKAGRYERGFDYYNCPMNRDQYIAFYEALVSAQRVVPHEFEKDCSFFEGCMPIEEVARRGIDTLRFGALKPVGLADPGTGREPYAVVQLRQDNIEGTMFNLVGFQTSLRYGEQERVFRSIPGLQNAEFVRFGVMHKNIYVNAPQVLDASLRLVTLKDINADVFLAGQLTGVEGYMESTAMGLVAALNMFCSLKQIPYIVFPRESAIGSLLDYLKNADAKRFQPINVNLGIFPPLHGKKIKSKTERCQMVAGRAIEKTLEMASEYDFI